MTTDEGARAPEAAPEPVEREKRSRRSLWLSLLTLVLLVGLGVGAWYAFPVRSVRVTGNHFLSAGRVAALAGVSKTFGWLYYGAWRARALEEHPWVLRANIRKVWPGTVQVSVTERTPGATIQHDGRSVVVDLDGTELPGAKPVAPFVRGWGPDRSREAIDAARLLGRFDVRSVIYTPSGFTVETSRGTLWSGSLLSLQKYGSGVTMYAGKRVSIYPWGVSVGE
ncbi:cell division protein FtsQ/DivIB [Deinococcus yavapaiensis]|uniref:cell division protein FtsQ/DivIB n=1 Tax=Deinococcus yavapaiensis TaxID=309889 RepID=UPI000DA2466B|nr:FtsQ-type POTRA domain-containing protein [Deinococcus yavapaiensis]